MVSFVVDGQDDNEHEFLREIEEEFFSDLKIPYQVIKMCTGDLGFPAVRKYDIEAWIPTQEKYREVTSTSTTGDFQARRLNIKYKEDLPTGGEKKYVNILNGTAFAIGRTLIAILENYQQEDGRVLIPPVLQKYTSFRYINFRPFYTIILFPIYIIQDINIRCGLFQSTTSDTHCCWSIATIVSR